MDEDGPGGRRDRRRLGRHALEGNRRGLRPEGVVLAAPPHGRIYHAAFPDFGGPESRVRAARIRAFERLAHRRIAWAYFSNNWLGGRIRFPAKHVRTIKRAGRVPFIRLMARSNFGAGPDPHFKMRSIARGAWDAELSEWCERARDADTPLLAEFGTEVNGDWFPWNGRWNGGGRTAGYGNPELADGPESFRDAYRRIVDICRGQGANQITWFFHVDVGGSPPKPWNRAARYYPGDAYIDWIGISDYGPLKPGQPWVGFRRRWTVLRTHRGAVGDASRSRCSSMEPRTSLASRGTRPAGSGVRFTMSRLAAGRAFEPSPTGTSGGETATDRGPTFTSIPLRKPSAPIAGGSRGACSADARGSCPGKGQLPGSARSPTEISSTGPVPVRGRLDPPQRVRAGASSKAQIGERRPLGGADGDHVRDPGRGRQRRWRRAGRLHADPAAAKLPDQVVAAVLGVEHALWRQHQGRAAAELRAQLGESGRVGRRPHRPVDERQRAGTRRGAQERDPQDTVPPRAGGEPGSRWPHRAFWRSHPEAHRAPPVVRRSATPGRRSTSRAATR